MSIKLQRSQAAPRILCLQHGLLRHAINVRIEAYRLYEGIGYLRFI